MDRLAALVTYCPGNARLRIASYDHFDDRYACAGKVLIIEKDPLCGPFFSHPPLAGAAPRPWLMVAQQHIARLSYMIQKSLALHLKYLNDSVAFHPKVLNKSLALHPKELNKSLALHLIHFKQKSCFAPRMFEHL